MVVEISFDVIYWKGYYIIRMREKQVADDTVIQGQIENLKAQLRQEKMQKIYTAWYNQLIENADIKDYRNQYF